MCVSGPARNNLSRPVARRPLPPRRIADEEAPPALPWGAGTIGLTAYLEQTRCLTDARDRLVSAMNASGQAICGARRPLWALFLNTRSGKAFPPRVQGFRITLDFRRIIACLIFAIIGVLRAYVISEVRRQSQRSRKEYRTLDRLSNNQ